MNNREAMRKVIWAFENIRNNYEGWQGNSNFKVLADYLQSQAQQPALTMSQFATKADYEAAMQSQAQQTTPEQKTMESAKEAFESSSIFTRYYSDEQTYSNCRYENEALNNSFIDFCEGYFSSPTQAQQPAKLVQYRHKNGNIWFHQSVKDELPSWAYDVRPYTSQAQQESQAARLLLLKLEIEQICDDVKYAKDAKLAIQKLDFSKAASLPPAPEVGA